MSTYTTSEIIPPQIDAVASGRHPVNVAHLVMGVAFLGLASIWTLFQTDAIGSDDLRWFLPLPWLAAGLAGLLAIALTGRRTTPDGATAPAAEPGAADVEPQ